MQAQIAPQDCTNNRVNIALFGMKYIATDISFTARQRKNSA